MDDAGTPRALYGIHEAAARAGVTPELVRAWERRYGLPRPATTAGGFRRYDDAFVERLRLLRELRDRGVRIPALVAAPLDRLRSVLDAEIGGGDRAAEASTAAVAPEPAEQLVRRLLAAAADWDVGALRSMLGGATRDRPALECATDVVLPFLAGLRTRRGGLAGPAPVERLAHALVADHLAAATASNPTIAGARRIVLAVPGAGAPAIELRLLGFSLAASGWDVVPLAGPLPYGDLAAACRSLGAQILALDLEDPPGPSSPAPDVGTLRGLASNLPSGGRLLIVGPAARAHARAVRISGGLPCATVEEAVDLAEGT